MTALLRPGWRSGIAEAGGIRLHYVEAGPADGHGLLLLHGFPEFWWAWRHQIQPLADAGLRVVVPDMRGCNESDAPPGPESYSLERLSADVLALADQLGLARFTLVGHDWGGIVAWTVAARAPVRVKQLVILNAPHPAIFADFARRHPVQIARSWYAAFFRLPCLPELVLRAFDFAALRAALCRTSRADTFAPGEFAPYVAAWSRPGRLSGMLNPYRAGRPGASKVGRILCRVTVVWGGRDAFLDPRLAHRSAALCRNADVIVLPAATHWLHLEEAGQVAAIVAKAAR